VSSFGQASSEYRNNVYAARSNLHAIIGAMEITSAQDAEVFRYITESGFAVETTCSVLPVFDSDEKTVTWRDLVPARQSFYSLPGFDPSSPLNSYFIPLEDYEPQAISFNLDFEKQIANWNENETDVICADTSALSTVPSNLSLFHPLDYETYVLENAVSNQIQLCLQCFEAPKVNYVDHVHNRAPLMAGKQYLIPKWERECTEAAADDNTIHLELLSLSRNHSDLNLFSAAIHKLKRFKWSIWQTFLNLSFGCSGCWARFSRSAHLCPSSIAVFSHSI
jgi:hypothetical protein